MKTILKPLTAVGLLASFLAGCAKTESLSPGQLTEHNKPGTVMIQTVHKAEFSVPDYTLDDARLDELAAALQQEGSMSEEQALVTVIAEVMEDPLYYFAPLNELIYQSAEISTTGSALAVTEDGYLVTNAHVVSSEQDDLKFSLADYALEDVAYDSCQIVWDGFDGFSQDAIGALMGTEEFTQLCLNAHVEYYAHYMNLDALETDIYAAMGGVTTLDEVLEEGHKATVEAMGEPTPGKDVAVLKIQADSMPTVSLGQDSDLTAGDRIFILGYPGAGTLDESETLEPSLTAGLVSARKTMSDGWDILQTDAAMNSGNSGGPVFNEAGEAIGIATFGKVDPATGGKVEGVNFVIPINVVEEFLDEADVEPALSDISQLYQEGVSQFDKERFPQALKTFRQVSEINSDYPYVQGYLSKSQKATSEQQGWPVPLWLILVGGTVAIGLGGGGLYLLSRRVKIGLPQFK